MKTTRITSYHWILTARDSQGRIASCSGDIDIQPTDTRQQIYDYIRTDCATRMGLPVEGIAVLYFAIAPMQF